MNEIYFHKTEQFISIVWAFDSSILSLSNSEKSKLYRSFLHNKLQEICEDKTVEMFFNNHGKPFIHSKKYQSISISHTLNFLSIQLHQEKIAGIDIETSREALCKIQSKFLVENEIVMANNDLSILCTMWTCKEAMFKIYGEKGISLKQNIRITHINLPYISARICYNNIEENYTLYSHYIYPITITYVVKKN